MDNNVFFKGKAIIDEQFNILSVDDELKDFLGDNISLILKLHDLYIQVI